MRKLGITRVVLEGRRGDEYVAPEMLAALRRAIGPERKIRVDANQAWNVPQAVRVLTRWNDEVGIDFAEAPVPIDPVENMRELRAKVSVALCANEGLGRVEDCLRVIRARFAVRDVGTVLDLLRAQTPTSEGWPGIVTWTHGIRREGDEASGMTVSMWTDFEAIRAVARGAAFLQPSIAGKVIAEFTRLSPYLPPQAQPLVEPLSERELDILRLLSQGASNKEIADDLVITVGTVKNHVTSILAKLGVRDRTQAALKAKELGIM